MYVRRGFGDEKSQLNDLNKRLDQYLSRVRQLEEENQVLVEEIHRLRLERGAECAQGYHTEVGKLRMKVEELTVQTCEAEIQKENIWLELQNLQELWEQVRAMRLKIDQQLTLHKQDLQQAKSSQAALEELYFRLQQERQMLQGSQQEELLALRDQALQIPLQITMQEVAQPRLRLTDVQSFSLELSESWKDAFFIYQKKIEELESSLRLSEEDRHGAEETVRIQRLQVEELRREYEELLGIQKMLEGELLRMKEKYRLEVEEYQIIIEELESERQTITVTITERLKDYHDLMQVKTGLSLEVAAYRALLEAENKKGALIWTEHSMRDQPAGYVTSTFDEATRFSHRGGKIIEYPINRSKEEIRRKTQTTDRFLTRTVPATQIRSQYTNLGNTSSSYVSRVHDNTTQGKRWDTSMSSRYDLSHNTKLPQTTYRIVKPTIVTPYSSTQSTVISETSKPEQIKDLKPVARPRTQSRESRKGQVTIGTEDKKHESSSQMALETKVITERKVISKSVEEEKQVSKSNEKYAPKGIIINEDTASVTDTVQKETIQEPKEQELPVKKERKKREQAKKRKEEVEKVEIGNVNVETRSKTEVHETTHVKKPVVLEEKTQAEQIIFELPIQVETRTNENNSQKGNMENKTKRNVSHTYINEEFAFHGSENEHKTDKIVDSSKTGDAVRTSSEPREERTVFNDILRHLGHSSVTSVETKQQGSGSRAIVLGEKMQGEPVVLEIPIKLEVSKTQLSSRKDNVEQSEQSTFARNDKQTHVNEEAMFKKSEEMHKTNKDVENKRSSNTEESMGVDISSEKFEKKAMVADILRQLGQPSVLDDTNITYAERMEHCSDGSVKTEIFVQSRTEEEIDLFDEPDLTDLWNTTMIQSSKKSGKGTAECLDQEQHSRSIKKTILEDVTGAEAEEWIGNIVHTGLKGSPGKSVNVEIVEETFETFGYDKGEFSTPFHVEEAEDSYNVEGSLNTAEHASMKTDKWHDKIQSTEGPTQVEEVTEGVNVDEETNYFVSIPEDNPYIEEEEEDTLRGQIHTEEESHVKYSWQDEFLQGSQGRKTLSEFVKYATDTEPSSTSHVTSEDSTDRLDNEEQKEDSPVESIVIEKKIQVPHEIQSSIMDLLSKDVKDPHEKLKGALDYLQGSLPQDLAEELAALAGEEQAQSSSLALDIKKVGQTEESGVVTIVAEINISQTMDIDNIEDLDKIEGIKNEKTTIHKSQFKSSEDLTSFQPKETGGSKESVSITVGRSNGQEVYTSEEISQKGPTTTSVHFSPTRELSLGPFSTNVSSFVKHVELGGHEQIFQEESRLDQSSSDELSPTEVNRSEHHIKLAPREMLSRKQIIFEGPISETLKLDIVKNTEDTSNQNISIRHIKISPTEKYPTEQIVFQGPIFKTVGIGANVTGDISVKENYIDGVNQACPNLSFARKEASDQETTSQSSEFTTGASKTISHFKLNAGETLKKEIILDGSIPRDHDLSRRITLETVNSADDSKPIEYNSDAQKIHVAKNIKYQGFVSEARQVADNSNLVESKDQSNVNTSIHHIKLSPSREQIVFEGPVSSNLPISVEDSSLLEDTNRSIRYIRLGSPETYTSEQVTFEGPTIESYESSDFFVSSPSSSNLPISVEDSSLLEDTNRSIRYIRLGSPETYTSEQATFEGPTTESYESTDFFVSSPSSSSNLPISGEDSSLLEDTNRSIRYIRLGSPETYTSEQATFEGPTTESYESTDFFVSSPSSSSNLPISGEDSSILEDTNRSIRYIRLGSPETYTSEQVSFEGPTTESYESSDFIVSSPFSSSSNLPISGEDSSALEDTNRSIRYIRLGSPETYTSEQVTFEGPTIESYESSDFFISSPSSSSSNLPISGEDSSLLENTNRSIRYIRLGSPETYTSEQATFEGPTTESYESSDFFVSSPSGDSNESERSIKHIILGPTEKSFTFQMDITKIATNYSGEERAQETGLVVTSRRFEGQPKLSQSYSELTDDPEVTESGYGEEEIAGVSQLPHNIVLHGQSITDMSELDKTVQLQRIVHQSHVVSDDKKVAVVYLDEEEESDQDYLRRSF